MPLDPLRFLSQLHGHLGWLAAAALVHPAVVLRKAGRRAPWAITLSTALVTAASSAGALLYGPYRETVKPSLFRVAPTVGWMFERKEHLAFGATALAWAGALAMVAARRGPAESRAHLAKASWVAFVASAAFALTSALLGTWVASVEGFCR